METKVGIIGYRMGNIGSLKNAFTALNAEVFVAETPEALGSATHLVLPGVGAFPMGMRNLRELGFEKVLKTLVLGEGRPLLGICLGMQLLASIGEEVEVCNGLSFIPGRVTRLKGGAVRIPHIGWNDTAVVRSNPLMEKADSGSCFYYVHSYHLVPENADDTFLECEYGQKFAAGVYRKNILGVQFHPEKSHADGITLLKKFLAFSGRE